MLTLTAHPCSQVTAALCCIIHGRHFKRVMAITASKKRGKKKKTIQALNNQFSQGNETGTQREKSYNCR